MGAKYFKAKIESGKTIKLPEDLDLEEGTEVSVILTESEKDISSTDIARLIEASDSFEFLKAEGEDIYSEDDSLI